MIGVSPPSGWLVRRVHGARALENGCSFQTHHKLVFREESKVTPAKSELVGWPQASASVQDLFGEAVQMKRGWR